MLQKFGIFKKFMLISERYGNPILNEFTLYFVLAQIS